MDDMTEMTKTSELPYETDRKQCLEKVSRVICDKLKSVTTMRCQQSGGNVVASMRNSALLSHSERLELAEKDAGILEIRQRGAATNAVVSVDRSMKCLTKSDPAEESLIHELALLCAESMKNSTMPDFAVVKKLATPELHAFLKRREHVSLLTATWKESLVMRDSYYYFDKVLSEALSRNRLISVGGSKNNPVHIDLYDDEGTTGSSSDKSVADFSTVHANKDSSKKLNGHGPRQIFKLAQNFPREDQENQMNGALESSNHSENWLEDLAYLVEKSISLHKNAVLGWIKDHATPRLWDLIELMELHHPDLNKDCWMSMLVPTGDWDYFRSLREVATNKVNLEKQTLSNHQVAARRRKRNKRSIIRTHNKKRKTVQVQPMMLKQVHGVGDPVFACFTLDVDAASSDWMYAIIIDFHINGKNEYGDIRSYDILFEDSDILELVPEIFVKYEEDYQWQKENDIEKMKGCEICVDPKSEDDYLRLRGWVEVKLLPGRYFNSICEAMRAHDTAFVKQNGAHVSPSDLNFPEDWWLPSDDGFSHAELCKSSCIEIGVQGIIKIAKTGDEADSDANVERNPHNAAKSSKREKNIKSADRSCESTHGATGLQGKMANGADKGMSVRRNPIDAEQLSKLGKNIKNADRNYESTTVAIGVQGKKGKGTDPSKTVQLKPSQGEMLSKHWKNIQKKAVQLTERQPAKLSKYWKNVKNIVRNYESAHVEIGVQGTKGKGADPCRTVQLKLSHGANKSFKLGTQSTDCNGTDIEIAAQGSKGDVVGSDLSHAAKSSILGTKIKNGDRNCGSAKVEIGVQDKTGDAADSRKGNRRDPSHAAKSLKLGKISESMATNDANPVLFAAVEQESHVDRNVSPVVVDYLRRYKAIISAYLSRRKERWVDLLDRARKENSVAITTNSEGEVQVLLARWRYRWFSFVKDERTRHEENLREIQELWMCDGIKGKFGPFALQRAVSKIHRIEARRREQWDLLESGMEKETREFIHQAWEVQLIEWEGFILDGIEERWNLFCSVEAALLEFHLESVGADLN